MRRHALVIVLLAACSYDDPPTSDGHFKCDATHACPDDQTCLGNICQRSADTTDGIACGAAGTCTPGQRCCVDTINPPRCIAASDDCPGPSAICDGRADCNASSSCCYTGTEVACGPSDCVAVACHTNADCPSETPNCCPGPSAAPWGMCQLLASC